TPEAVIFEKPSSNRNMRTIYRLTGLCVLTEVLAAHKGIFKVYQYPHQSVKKHWTGNGRAEKADMIHHAKLRGFDPQDDNAADALGLLSCAMSIICNEELRAA